MTVQRFEVEVLFQDADGNAQGARLNVCTSLGDDYAINRAIDMVKAANPGCRIDGAYCIEREWSLIDA